MKTRTLPTTGSHSRGPQMRSFMSTTGTVPFIALAANDVAGPGQIAVDDGTTHFGESRP
jgi:hypothetical protein